VRVFSSHSRSLPLDTEDIFVVLSKNVKHFFFLDTLQIFFFKDEIENLFFFNLKKNRLESRVENID